jgi:carbamoyl-phosphate synthase small subunit
MKLIANKNINAVLYISDGSYFFGKGIGKKSETIGEICFNTSMTGYQEILTDPSYSGQIITFTFPHIGNVGCNDQDKESSKSHCNGLVVREDITEESNFRSQTHFNQWLINNNLTGICGIDTRALTRSIRDKGPKNVIISFVNDSEEIDTDKLADKIANFPTLEGMELCVKVSTKKPYHWQRRPDNINTNIVRPPNKYKVVVIDFGVKKSILDCLVDSGFDILVLPAKSSFEEIAKHNPDGIFLSNGPGDPLATSQYAAATIKKLLEHNYPIFGICMGHQLLAIAYDLKTIKMFNGHRGANHPVKNLTNNRVEITSQNHGFCVQSENIPNNIEITHVSLFDNSIEGLKLKDKLAFSVQHHPESSPGPHDSKYLFAQFAALIDQSKKTSKCLN